MERHRQPGVASVPMPSQAKQQRNKQALSPFLHYSTRDIEKKKEDGAENPQEAGRTNGWILLKKHLQLAAFDAEATRGTRRRAGESRGCGWMMGMCESGCHVSG